VRNSSSAARENEPCSATAIKAFNARLSIGEEYLFVSSIGIAKWNSKVNKLELELLIWARYNSPLLTYVED
jgi:hypothetical protein